MDVTLHEKSLSNYWEWLGGSSSSLILVRMFFECSSMFLLAIFSWAKYKVYNYLLEKWTKYGLACSTNFLTHVLGILRIPVFIFLFLSNINLRIMRILGFSKDILRILIHFREFCGFCPFSQKLMFLKILNGPIREYWCSKIKNFLFRVTI